MALFADYEPARRGGAPPADLATREAQAEDVPELGALRAARDGIPEAEAAAVFGDLLARARATQAVVLVAEVAGALAGYGAAERLARPGLPEGWYLAGVVVAPALRRRGIGARLTADRLSWIAARAGEAYYFVNERNRASIDLHARFGFRELVRDLRVPGLTFTGGVGLLFRADLSSAR